MESQLNGITTHSMESQLNGITREKKERERSQDERKGAATTNCLFTNGDPSFVSYIIFDFIHAADQPPDPASFCANLARIHSNGPLSGSFGFCGLVPISQSISIPTAPSSDRDWPRFFLSLVLSLFQQDLELNGRWPVYEQAFDNVVHRLIPRLLGCLQSDGIRPSLVHGNLSDGNIAVDAATGMPVIFSACAMYAHHEYELGMSRVSACGLDEAYLDTYVRYVKPSHPRGEFRDRVMLYGIKFNLDSSVSGRNPVARER